MKNIGSPFFFPRRRSLKIVQPFGDAQVSKVSGHVVTRPQANAARASKVSGHTVVRPQGNAARVAKVSGHVILKLIQRVLFNNYYGFNYNSPSAEVRYQVNADGFVYATSPFGLLELQYQWLKSGVVSDYELRMTVIAGFNPWTGTIDTWLDLASTWEWTVFSSEEFTYETTMLLEVRDKATQTIQDTATIDMAATAGGSFL